MAIEKHMLQTHSLFEKAGEVFEGVAKLKERIAELEAENKKQAKLLESAKRVENTYRELYKKNKHALWLARAERAADRARIFYFCDLDEKLDIDGYSYDSNKKKGYKKLTARLWRIIWLKVERKCREKAEEYK